MDYVVVAALAYLIGALPSAYVIVRLLTGRDIRGLGTGNVGVMNTVRQAGLPAGMLAFLGEGAKGIGVISVSKTLVGTPQADVVAAIMALVGVNWSVFMRFAGGRGTTISVFMALALLWPLVVVMGVTWLLLYRLRRDNFFATRMNLILMPFITAAVVQATGESWLYVALTTAGALVTLSRHRRETDDHYLAATARVRSK